MDHNLRTPYFTKDAKNQLHSEFIVSNSSSVRLSNYSRTIDLKQKQILLFDWDWHETNISIAVIKYYSTWSIMASTIVLYYVRLTTQVASRNLIQALQLEPTRNPFSTWKRKNFFKLAKAKRKTVRHFCW